MIREKGIGVRILSEINNVDIEVCTEEHFGAPQCSFYSCGIRVVQEYDILRMTVDKLCLIRRERRAACRGAESVYPSTIIIISRARMVSLL